MIGDTKYDREGAEGAGAAFVGAAYGYGSREELTAGHFSWRGGLPAGAAPLPAPLNRSFFSRLRLTFRKRRGTIKKIQNGFDREK